MKKSRFTESQIVAVLREGDEWHPGRRGHAEAWDQSGNVLPVETEVGGAAVAELRRLKKIEAENAKLKQMYADMALENAAIKDVLSRKL